MGPRWRYLFQEVFIGLRRNLLMTVATVVTVTVSLAVAGGAFLMFKQVNLTKEVLYGAVEISMFLHKDISPEQIDEISTALHDNPLVQEVIYESQDDAYRNAQKLFKNDPELLEALTPDDLPASFRVKLEDPEQFEVVASQFRGYPGIEEVVDQRDVLKGFFRIMGSATGTAIAIATLQGVAAIALIVNTIRISAFARREQTGIMKLVGATNWYIRLPFVLEGVVAGIAGALIAGLLLVVGDVFLLAQIKDQIKAFPLIGTTDVLSVIPLMVMIGGLLSGFAAFFSLRRFLDV